MILNLNVIALHDFKYDILEYKKARHYQISELNLLNLRESQ